MKYLAIDYGQKKIGLAISDSSGTVAMPYAIVSNSRNFIQELEEIIKKEQIDEIVFGESKDFKNQDNYINTEIKKVAKKVQQDLKIQVHFINEVFTSMQAKWGTEKQIRRSHKKSRKSGAEKRIDDKAAMMILQTFLSKRNSF